MAKTRVYSYTIVEGEHIGHRVVTDAFGIDYRGRDPETAVYCLDCHEELDLYEVEEAKEAEQVE